MKNLSQTSTETQNLTSTTPNAGTDRLELGIERPDPSVPAPGPAVAESPGPEMPGVVILPPRSGRGFTLNMGLGFWLVTHNGQQAAPKHEIGLDVAWLMGHPGESFHALDLAGRVYAAGGTAGHSSGMEVENPGTGARAVADVGATVQQRGLRLEEAETMRMVLQEQ